MVELREDGLRNDLNTVVASYGKSTTSKLSAPRLAGAPEDQLRAPLEALVKDIARLSGLSRDDVVFVGEHDLPDSRSRPDYAVLVKGALAGFIEIKAPGKGADPRDFSDHHDRRQWVKLRPLPNLLYTDGNSFCLWRDGEQAGEVVHVTGDVRTSGEALRAPQSLVERLTDFLTWNPIAPTSARQLAEISARLCKVLRDEVSDLLEKGNVALGGLAEDWRKLLFPNATDKQFADGYSQAVTFGLLLARERNISLEAGIDVAAQELRETSSLIGTALKVLTDEPTLKKSLKTSLSMMARVLQAVDWDRVARRQKNAWIYFYEDFLEVYDNDLRKQTGSYYTPKEVVDAMVRLVDEALQDRKRFDQPLGLASPEVTVVDPAVGTGTFLMGILDRISGNVMAHEGAGAVEQGLTDAASRLVGFELQLGPFAVAQLRIQAEIRRLIEVAAGTGLEEVPTHEMEPPVAPQLRLYVTDTLASPYEELEWFAKILGPLADSRRMANVVKRDEPITVVIGNPPYKDNAKGRGGWIEAGDKNRPAPFKRWALPPEWGLGAHARNLRNLYVYFWRWATWKVFGDEAVDKGDGRPGIVCFITVAGFLNGPGFEQMRADLRRSSEEIWVVNCTPEGHQPEVNTRVFQDVQQPVCIVLALRIKNTSKEQPARVRFASLPFGRRETKFAALGSLKLDDGSWVVCPSGWRAPFLPEHAGAWATFPALQRLFVYDGPGVMPGRTWAVAPDPRSLHDRWAALISEKDDARKEALFHPQLRKGKSASRHIRKLVPQGLGARPARLSTIIDDREGAESPIRYGFRSFDPQWIIPDARLLNDVRPELWNRQSGCQVYLTCFEAHSPTSGPVATFTGFVPDQHHYRGNFGGRVYPLWEDANADRSNICPGLLRLLEKAYGHPVSGEDVMAYLAAVMSHPGFMDMFAEELKRPGLRVPLTKSAELFAKAVKIGRRLIWLHTYGERYGEGQANGRPRLKSRRPVIPAGGSIRGPNGSLPDTLDYDPKCRRLKIGEGFVDNVWPSVWAYEVSGKQVVRQWFSHRKKDRTKRQIGDRRPPSDLDKVQPEAWLAEYNRDLIDLLNVLSLVVALEPKQMDLLRQICDAPTFTQPELDAAGAIRPLRSRVSRRGKKAAGGQTDLLTRLPDTSGDPA